ncbi:MAG TPA: 2-hydroxychromene-2-carboxylate isomerase [Caulobacteraceae bacterium]|jgi:2-hydroxychromene-2-carboxylate isomerase|nr:2-hydroxychromene-2-carboxylate isomerase [Caulobacteraceae bacterium]
MAAPSNVLFYFDFGSPNAYLSHKVIPGIEARTGIKFRYVPVLLGGLFKLTGNRSPAEAFAGIKNKLAYEGLETQRFVRRHGLTAYRPNPHFPVNTLKIMRGAVAAQRQGVFEPYVEAVYGAMWEQGLKMDDPEVIAAALTAAGLDAAALMAGTEDPEVKQALMHNTNTAFEAGAFGSPSFLVDGELYFGKDRLRDVEEAIAGN